MKTIEYYFDFLSPFSFVSWKLYHKEDFHTQVKTLYKPVPMGTLFNHHEIKGPALIESKRIVLLKNILRVCHHHQIDFKAPVSFPFNPLYALRLACMAVEKSDIEFLETMWNGCWTHQINFNNPDEICDYLAGQTEYKRENLEEYLYDKEIKNILKKNVKDAIDKQLFGVPSFYIDKEIFWGFDSLQSLKDFVHGHDLFNHYTIEQLTSE